jgi:predicted RNA-binding Zn ribbon-like protein
MVAMRQAKADAMAGREFVFVGEALAFDFVNTAIAVRRRPVDLLQAPEDLAAWWDEAAARYSMSMDAPHLPDAGFERAKALRDALRRIFDAVVNETSPSEGDIEVLNSVLGAGQTRLSLLAGNRFSMRQFSTDDHARLLPIAHSAAWLLTECDRTRLHKCKNDQCVLMFLDTTKNGSRVWCSIECMNRARSRENYARGNRKDR